MHRCFCKEISIKKRIKKKNKKIALNVDIFIKNKLTSLNLKIYIMKRTLSISDRKILSDAHQVLNSIPENQFIKKKLLTMKMAAVV